MTLLLTNDYYKQQIAARFGNAAIVYNAYAQLQYECAQYFLEIIKNYQFCIPQGTILEIGCGTGLITQELINTFPHHPLHITDISSKMVEFCQLCMLIPDHRLAMISFGFMDGEQIDRSSQHYGAIVGGFVVQWFRDLEQGVQRLIDQLQPGGYLFLSFPTCHSFPEWQQVCQQINVPFTANSLPNPEMLCQALPECVQVCHMEVIERSTTHVSAGDFFRGLKAIGATVSSTGQRLSLRQMKQLIHTWDDQFSGQIRVRYQVAFWIIQRHDD
jgi:malonyl-CoA O-methyltransferase